MSNSVYVLNIPWEMRGFAPSLGASYDKNQKAWLFRGEELPPALIPYGSEDFSWERWIEDNINGKVRPVATLPQMTPRPHQMIAAKKIAAARKKGFRGFIEADDVGVGKTISCLIGAYGVAKIDGFSAQNKAKLLIVTTKAAIPHWRNTVAASGVSHLFRVVVINYDQAKKLLDPPKSAQTAKRTRTKNQQTANKGTPTVNWDIIISDESHRLKNSQVSQRAKAFDRIARYSQTAKAAPFVIWASATIGQNVVELGYLIPLISQMTGNAKTSVHDWSKYLVDNKYHVTIGKTGAATWIKPIEGMSTEEKHKILIARQQDLKRMRELLFSPNAPSIRRLPKNIAGWPEIQRIPVPIALGPKNRILYEAAWLEFRQKLALFKKGKNPKGGLAIQLRFRQKASLLKVDETLEQIQDLLDNGHQVAVSVEFIEPLDIMKKALEAKGISCVEISGRTSNTREEERLKFQRGQAKVAFFTVTEAISLHAGEQLRDGSFASLTQRATVVHDIRYSSISSVQCEGRCHRDGMASNVYYMFLKNTVEETILNTMLQRMANMKNLSGDASADILEIELLLEETALA